MDLEELVSDFDRENITEPAYMDKLSMYLQDVKEEDQEFIELLAEKMANEFVSWPLPWYQQSKSLTRPLKENENEGETYVTGIFSKSENETILENWLKLIKKYDLPDKLASFARWKNKNNSRNPRGREEYARYIVTAHLARGLNRTLYHVYKHVVNYFGAPVKGPYKDYEEIVVEICFHHKPENAVTILSMLLGREPRNIYKRLHSSYKENNLKSPRIKWTVKLATELLGHLMEELNCSLEDLKNKTIPLATWMTIEEKMQQPFPKLQRFWYHSLHVQLFVKYDVKMKRLKKKIFKMLRNFNHYQAWTDIRWKEVAKELPDGFTPSFLRQSVLATIRGSYNNKWNSLPLEEIINECLTKLANNKGTKKKRLKSLVLNKKGELEVIRHDCKL